MSVTNPTGNPATYPATVERKSEGEPSTDFWTNTFDPLLNRTSYLQDQLLGTTNGLRPNLSSQVSTSSGVRLVGVEAHTGANGQGDTAAQTLFALLGTIWDTKGGLDSPSQWTQIQDLSKGFQVSESTSTASMLCRKQAIRPRVVLSDADHTIDVTQADRFVLSGSPAAPRVITLDSTTEVPAAGETMMLLIANLTTSAQPAYTIQREGGTVVATINGNGSGDAGAITVEVEFSESAWHLGITSGCYYDDNTFTTFAGVLPGAGA